MNMAKSFAIIDRNKEYILLFLFFSFFCYYVGLYDYLKITDWSGTFAIALKNLKNPYDYNFVNPPYALIFIIWGKFFSVNLGSFLNRIVLVLTSIIFLNRNNCNFYTSLLSLTSYPFILLLMLNNIDWITLLVFILPFEFGIIALFSKPQVLLFTGIIKFIKEKNKFRVIFFCLFVSIILFSLYPNWKFNMPYDTNGNVGHLFPYFVPFGLFLLYISIIKKDEFLAGIATPFLMPYFGFWSFGITFQLIAVKNKNIFFALWILTWIIGVLSTLDKFI